jgi:hypothetical protein
LHAVVLVGFVLVAAGCRPLSTQSRGPVTEKEAIELAKTELRRIGSSQSALLKMRVVDHPERNEWLIGFDQEHPDPGSATLVTVNKTTRKATVYLGR